MKSITLTQRQKNIIHMIPHKDENATTISEIAKKLGLSSRTVQRDFVDIEIFLSDNDFNLVKKSGSGIFLDEEKQTLNYIYELLDMIDSSKHYDRLERQNFILSRILTSNQAIKYSAFIRYLNISEKTLVDDLKQVEGWLEKSNLKLIKKRGEGVYVEGKEESFRKAQTRLIYESIDYEKRLMLIKEISDEVKFDLIHENNIMSMIDRKIIEKTRSALNRVFSSLKISISDNAYVGLVVHISLAIERLKLNEHIEINTDRFNLSTKTQEYIFAEKIVRELEDEFQMEIPKIEISYISMHIKGANIITYNRDAMDMEDIMEAYQVTKALIVEMEKIFKLDLDEDLRLEADLRAHISTAISRLKLNLAIRNPILDDIKEKYMEIFANLISISPSIFYEYSKIDKNKNIPEDEIGYIAIHFISSIEKRIIERIKINVLTICPTGFGTSKLLATNLRNKINNVNVVGNASVLNINKELIAEKGVDLIISTVNLQDFFEGDHIFDTPYIEVSAITDEKEYSQISSHISDLSRSKYYSELADNLQAPLDLMNNQIEPFDIKENEHNFAFEIYQTSARLNKLFEDIRFFRKKGIKELERLSSSIVANTDYEFNTIKDALLERNKLGGTFFKQYNLHLVHAACSISSPRLAFGHLSDTGENIIIMISQSEHHEDIVKLFGMLSSKIIENDKLISNIEDLNEDEIKSIVFEEIMKLIEEKLKKEIMMELKLEDKHIFLNLDSVTKEEAIIAAGKELQALGCVDEDYIDYMLEREKVMTTYMGLGIAIPHGTNEAKNSIKESGVVFMQYPNGVDFGEEKAYLVIGIAGKGDEHLEILSNIAIKISDELVEKLKTTDKKEDFIEEFGA